LHLLHHVEEQCRLYRPLRNYATEIQEQQNGDMRKCILRTTGHNASKDIHRRYDIEGLHTLMSGGMYAYYNSNPDSIQLISNLSPSSSQIQTEQLKFILYSPFKPQESQLNKVCTEESFVYFKLCLNDDDVIGTT
jgi:hypothetical protein